MQKTFPNVTPDQMDNLRKQLADHGINVPPGTGGVITGSGVTANFSYDGTATLSVTLVSKPWYLPASMIFDQIQSHLG